MKKVAKFCASNSQFCDSGTAPIYRLISIPDEDVRQNAISSASKALESGKNPVSGKFLKDKRLTEKDVKSIIDASYKEVRTNLTEESKKEKPTVFPEHVPPAPVTVPIPSDPAKPVQPSLAAQQAAKDCPAGGCKDVETCPDACRVITDTTGKVSVKGDSNLDPRMAPVIQSAIEESGGRRSTVMPAGAPYRESDPKYKPSPFLTATQLMAHDKDPLEVGKMFQQASIRDLQTVQPKTEKERFMDACQSAYEHGKPDFKLAIDELMRYHPSWKDPGTVIYFCVTDPKEAIQAGRKS